MPRDGEIGFLGRVQENTAICTRNRQHFFKANYKKRKILALTHI